MLEEDCCTICYVNPITKEGDPVPKGDLATVELECKHRFCSECTLEQLKSHIELAKIDKLVCFDFECKKPISAGKMKEILKNDHKMEDLYAKYERFRDQKSLDSDPLVRWCPKPGCAQAIRAPNKDASKLVCSKCSTEVCFKCRDAWHGEKITCEEAMGK